MKRLTTLLAASALLASSGVATASEEPSSLQMSFIETGDLKLIYFDGLKYLTPYVVRSFTNSTNWQKRAPREMASRPMAPVPAKRSSTRAPSQPVRCQSSGWRCVRSEPTPS